MIELDQFAQKRPFLYHLTAGVNVDSITTSGTLFSASVLLEAADEAEAKVFLRVRRPQHLTIKLNGRLLQIRDQRPLSEKALAKCLEGDLRPADYYEILNSRVFLWPTIQRLQKHYDRYKDEKPTLLRFSTSQIIALNPNLEFSRLNSGATRANSYLGGIAPRRGRGTFRLAKAFDYGISAIAEVTLQQRCLLPRTFECARTPAGPWLLVKLPDTSV